MIRILPLLIALLLAGCSSLKFWGDDTQTTDAQTEDTSQAGQDVAAGKAVAGEPDEPAKLEKIDSQVELDRLWRIGVGKAQEAFEAMLRPAFAEDSVYAAGRQGRVVAVDAADGDRRWRTDLDVSLTGGVGAGGGLVLVGALSGDLVALHADSGEEAWRANLSSEILAPAAVSGDLVVVQTQDAKVHGLAAGDGSQRWLFETDLPVLTLRGTTMPVIADGQVLVAFANGKLVALDAESGNPRWEARVAMPGGRTELERMVDLNTPLLVGDIVYAVSYQGRAGAFTRGSGRELWTREASSYRAPAHSLNQFYLVDTRDHVIALRATSGQELWRNPALRGRQLTGPVAIADLVAVADTEGYLHLLAAVDGRLVGRTKVDGDGVSVPVVTDGERLFVQDNGGDLSAYVVRGSAQE